MPDNPHPPSGKAPDDKPVCAQTHFRVLREHAKGGLGQVAVALDEELSREIAFKEIQPQFADMVDARDRFVREAEITGGLEHPGIVPVYGVGQHDNGRPFYAMRFVHGDSLRDAITAFHESEKPGRDRGERRLAIQKLLGRFLDVCHAIEYAHSRGVLHRDLKPDNIMLGEYGETLVVDWGLAKTVSRTDAPAGGAEATILLTSGSSGQETRHGSSIGTPAFMSPEQAAGKIDDLGPATDVYALGATLYAVLTGRPPIEQADADVMLAQVIAGNFPHPRQVKSSIPKPLAAICIKAMANHPAERYESAAALANDIEHYLADERVTAHRESWIDRAFRWGRRYKTFARAAAISLVIIAGVSIAFALVADNLRSRAVQAEAKTNMALDEKTEALEKETAAREEADEVRERFINAFRSPDPAIDGRNVKVVDVLDRFVDELDKDEHMSPTLRAALSSAIGSTYFALGRFKEALPLHNNALKLRKAKLGLDHALTLASMTSLALAYERADELDQARQLFETTLRLTTEKFGPDDPKTLTTMNNLALVHKSAGELDRSQQLLEKTLELRKAKLGPDHRDTLMSMNNLAVVLQNLGKMNLAVPLLEEAMNLQKVKLGPDHPHTLASMSNLALAYQKAGKLDQALSLNEETVKRHKAKLGPDHPDTLVSMNNLALAYERAGKLDQALSLSEETLQLRKTKLGPDHQNTLVSMANLAIMYRAAGELDKSVSLLEEAYERLKEKLGPNHPSTLTSMNNLAVVCLGAGKREKALPLFEETLRIRKTKLGPDHPTTLTSMANLAMVYKRMGKLDQATSLLQETLELEKTKLGPDHPNTLDSMNSLTSVYFQEKNYTEAERICRESLQLRRGSYPDHWLTFDNAARLGEVLTELAKYAEAEPLLLEGIKGMEQRLATISPIDRSLISDRIESLVELYEAWGEPRKAAQWRERLENASPADKGER